MYFFYYYLLQVTKATSSVAMGPVAFKRCVDFILDVITTDRPPSIRLPSYTTRVRHLACCKGYV